MWGSDVQECEGIYCSRLQPCHVGVCLIFKVLAKNLQIRRTDSLKHPDSMRLRLNSIEIDHSSFKLRRPFVDLKVTNEKRFQK